MQHYTLADFKRIEADGFDYVIPKDVLDKINKISSLVGSPAYIKTPSFAKNSNSKPKSAGGGGAAGAGAAGGGRRTNRAMEITSPDEWDSLRSFQTTALAERVGIDKLLDETRFCINKMSAETFEEMCEKIIELIEPLSPEDLDLRTKCMGFSNISVPIFKLHCLAQPFQLECRVLQRNF